MLAGPAAFTTRKPLFGFRDFAKAAARFSFPVSLFPQHPTPHSVSGF
jgi:hypothetical protein